MVSFAGKRNRTGWTLLVALLLFPALSQAGWYNPNWLHRQKITIQPSLADADLTGFPCLVKITDAANELFTEALPSGHDILFTAADGTLKLDHELEKYDSATKELYAWVQVPLISSSVVTEIYLYYGNGSVVVSEENVEDTWDDDFVMVQHLQETSGTHFDSTSRNNDGTPANGVTQNAVGRIDGADQFDGVNDKVDVADDPTLRVVEMTLEAWVYVPGSPPGGFEGIVVHGQNTSNWYGLFTNSNRFHFRWSSGTVRRTDFISTFVADRWYYIAGVLDVPGDEARTYQDDALDRFVSGPDPPTPASGPLYLGHTFPSGEFFQGFIDEVRISKIARSPAWIKASARVQGDPDSYQTLAAPEVPPLSIVKRAFQADGTVITNGSTLPAGTPVKFLLYVDNPSGAATDASLQDILDPLFGYQTGSMKIDNTLVSSVVCPGGVCNEATIFAQVDGAGTPIGDGDAVALPVDADVGSYSSGTKTIDLGDGTNTNNAQLDLAADRVWALVFTVNIQ